MADPEIKTEKIDVNQQLLKFSLNAAVFSIFTSMWMLISYLVFRWLYNFEWKMYVYPGSVSFLYTFLICVTPYLGVRFFSISFPFLMLPPLLLFFFVALISLLFPTAVFTLHIIIIISFLIIAFHIRKEFVQLGRKNLTFHLLVSGLIVLFLLSWLWQVDGTKSGIFHSLVIPELGFGGVLYGDVYFHTALSNMIRNYGVASVGIDGLQHYPYHIGGHIWFAGMFSFMQMSGIYANGPLKLIVLIPVFISIAIIAMGSVNRAVLSSPVLSIFILAVLLIFRDGILGWIGIYSSETYVIAAMFFLAGIPFIMRVMAGEKGFRQLILYLLTYFFVSLLAFCCKIHVGFIMQVILGILCLTIMKNLYIKIMFTALCMAVTLTGLIFISPYSLFELLPQVHYLNYSAYNPEAFILYFMPVLLIFIYRSKYRPEYMNKELLYIIFIPVGLVAFYMFFQIGDTSGHMMTLSVNMLVVCLLASFLTEQLCINEYKPPQLIYWTGIILLPIFVGFNLKYALNLIGGNDSILNEPLVDSRRQYMKNLNTQTENITKDVLVNITPSNLYFWKIAPVCFSKALLVPALLERPMLQGYPSDSLSCRSLLSGYGHNKSVSTRSDQRLSLQEKCMLVKARGFNNFISLESESSELNALISCS